jgi:hypothetical protein
MTPVFLKSDGLQNFSIHFKHYHTNEICSRIAYKAIQDYLIYNSEYVFSAINKVYKECIEINLSEHFLNQCIVARLNAFVLEALEFRNQLGEEIQQRGWLPLNFS